MKQLKPGVKLCLAALLLPACATLNNGTSDFFRIDSVPQGAIATTSIETHASEKARRKNPSLKPVYLGCSPTPCAIKLNRRAEFVIKLEHPEFQTAEMFITNSRNSGSFTANMAATTATTAGTVTAGAIAGAGLAASLSLVTTATVNATLAAGATISTFGLIPIETSLAATNSLFVAPTVSTGSAVAAAIPPALAVTGGMLMVDAVSGANINIYPNPVVLELAPKGVETKLDPNVHKFKAELATLETGTAECYEKHKSVTLRKQCILSAEKKYRGLKLERRKEAQAEIKENARQQRELKHKEKE